MPRPKEFDPQEALDKAVDLFWRQGYEFTSIQDLVDHLGINRASLYETFGDKHQLFLGAMDRYCETVVRERFKPLEQPDADLTTIRRYFLDLVDIAGTPAAKKACLVANSAMELAPHEKDISARILKTFEWMEGAFYRVLQRAHTAGIIEKGKDPRALARFFTGFLQGGAVLAKAGADRTVLEQYVHVGLSVLD